MAIVFALIASLGHAFESYFIRKGLIETPAPLTAAFVTLTINLAFFIVLSLILLPSGLLTWDRIYLFILAGMFAPGIARAVYYKSLETLGMSISMPIISSDTLFGVTMALIFLKEPFHLLLAIGILSVVSGITLLSYEMGRFQKMDASRLFRYRHLLYPLIAAFLFGSSVFLRKLGLRVTNSPLLGATVTLATSWCIFALFTTTRGNIKRVFHVKKRSFQYFLMGACMSCITWLSFFHGLNIGRVSIVQPITDTYPIFTLVLSGTLLRGAERITIKIVVGTFLIVGGVVTLCLVK